MTFNDLYLAYLDALPGSRNNAGCIKFRTHLERNLCRLLRSVNDRTLRCEDMRAFIVRRPSVREILDNGFASVVLCHHVHLRTEHLLYSCLSQNVYNNIRGRGTDKAISVLCEGMTEFAYGNGGFCGLAANHVELGGKNDRIRRLISDGRKNATSSSRPFAEPYVIKIDIKNCFASAVRHLACSAFADMIRESYDGDDIDELLWLVMVIGEADAKRHAVRVGDVSAWGLLPFGKSIYDKPDGVGFVPGSLLVQDIMGVYLSPIDRWLESEGIWHLRYMDDVVMLTYDVEAFLSYVMPRLRQIISRLGLSLNERKFYCQPVSHGVEFLGSHVKPGSVWLNKRTIGQGVDKLLSSGKKGDAASLDYCAAVANSLAGLMKNRSNVRDVRRLSSTVADATGGKVEYDDKRMSFAVQACKGLRRERLIKILGHDEKRNFKRDSEAEGARARCKEAVGRN